MGTIQKHYDLEVAKENASLELLIILSKILLRKTLTLNEWKMSGRFISREDFLADNPTEKLKDECVQVVEYIGKDYLQIDSDGVFHYKDILSSNRIGTIESELWLLIGEKFWCENC